jgi:oligopeptide/dipeptide ABC transporter ATP-binding protein
MTQLQLTGVGLRRAGRHVLSDINLTCSPAECIAVVGESGCGKTSLAQVAAGLIQPDEGVVVSGSSQSSDRLAWAQSVHLLFQDAGQALSPVFTVEEAIQEPRVVLGQTVDASTLAITLERVGLDASVTHRRVRTLSGGQRQRVALARALVSPAWCLVLDEPTSALDFRLTALVHEVIAEEVHARRGVCLITHDLASVGVLAASVFVLYAGRVVESGPTSLIRERARHHYTAALWAASDRLTPIAGEPGAALSSGCAFAPRCPSASAQCSQQPPLVREGEHAVACWHPR